MEQNLSQQGYDHLRNLEEKHVPIVKDQLKYILSLATGALLFSITFVEKIAPTPSYKWLIMTGWLCLLLSIVTGIATIVSLYKFFSYIESFKSFSVNPYLLNLFFKPNHFEGQIIRPFLSDDVLAAIMGKRLEDIQPDDLAKYRQELLTNGQILKDIKRNLKSSKGEQINVLRELIKLIESSQKALSFSTPSKTLKAIRKHGFRVVVYPLITLWSFYAGLVLITVFSILNFI